MPAVLGTLIVVATLAGAIDHFARTSYTSGVLWDQRARAEWVLQAGLNRATKALVTPGDPMREALFDRRSVSWDFGGEHISLRLESESEKVDVNVADPELVVRRVTQAWADTPAGLVDEVTSRLATFRSRHRLVPSLEALLPFDRRSGPVAYRLRQIVTAFSGQPTPTLSAVTQRQESEAMDDVADPMSSAGLADRPDSPASSIGRPLYRLTASLIHHSSSAPVEPRSSSVMIMLSANEPDRFRVIEGHL